MSKYSNLFKRAQALVLALAMVLSVMNVGLWLNVSADDQTPVVKTDGAIVADNYDLTDAEKELLSSGWLIGNSYTYYKPTDDDELVDVDSDSKTITADVYTNDGYEWIPVSADIVVGDQTVASVTLTNGEGKYDYDGDAFSVQVKYEMAFEVDEATQTTLLNAPAYLKQGIANLDAVKDSNSQLSGIASNMDNSMLTELMNGYVIPLGSGLTIKFDQATIDAINALRAQLDANGDDKLNLSLDVDAYKAADSKVGYLVSEGAAVKDELEATYGYVSAIKSDSVLSNSLLTAYLESFDPAKLALFNALISALDAWLEPMTAVVEDPWTATATDLLADDLNAVQLGGLDLLVADLGTVTEAPAVKNPLVVDTAVVKFNMKMHDVNVKVVLNAVDAKNTVSEYGVYEGTVVLADGATAEQIVAAVAASNIEADALASWKDVYSADHFTAEYTDITANLSEDIDYVITYSPKSYTVTFGETPNEYPYGYQYELATYADTNGDEGLVYDYFVNGVYVPEGTVITIAGDTAITREYGKAYVSSNLNEIVSKVYLTAGDKASSILTSGALLIGDEMISVRYPDNDDGKLVALDGDTLTVGEYASDYNALVWVPYSYTVVNGTEKTEHKFDGAKEVTITEDEYDYVEIVYTLDLEVSDEDVLEILNLPATLVSEATAQKSALDRISAAGYLDNMASLTDFTLGTLINSLKDPSAPALNADADKDAQLKAYFIDLITKIRAEGMSEDGKLTIYELLTQYADPYSGGLAFYYLNSDEILEEIDRISTYLTQMIDDEDKENALKILLDAFGYGSLVEKIENLESAMASVKENLTAPNAAINLESANLNKLVNALLAEGTVDEWSELPQSLALTSDKFVLAADKVAVITPVVKIGNETITLPSYSFDKDYVLTDSDIDAIIADINAAAAGASDKYYVTDYSEAQIKALVGMTADEAASETSFSFTWTLKEFVVQIEGADDQVVTKDSLTILLPAPTQENIVYRYTIDGEVISVSSKAVEYTLTLDQLDSLFADGKLTVAREAIDMTRENLINLVDLLNDSIGNDSVVFALSENNGELSIVMKVDAADYSALPTAAQDALMAYVLRSGYSYMGLDNKPFVSDSKFSLQTLVDVVLSSGVGTDTLLAVMNADGSINNLELEGTIISNKPLTTLGGLLMKTTMQVGSSADKVTSVPLYVTLGDAPNALVEVRNMLAGRVGNYVQADCANGSANLYLNLPKKAYEAYLAVLLLTENRDFTNLNEVNGEIAIGFLQDHVEPLLSGDITVNTLNNTLAMIGYDLDLSAYENLYAKLYPELCQIYDNCEFTYDAKSGTATGFADIGALIKRYAGNLASMIAEYDAENGTANIDFVVSVTLENLETDFEALYIDVKADGVTNKAGLAEDLAAKLETIAGGSVIVLLDDIDGDLTFNTTTVLDLNGKTVNGNIVCNADVIIVDTALDESVCGEVTGTVSGNAHIISGKYASDVSAFIKNGYTQDDAGVVSNKYFTVKADADGNITVELDAGVLAMDSVPSIRAMAVDLATELIFNGYTVNKLYVDGNMVYDIELEDLLGIYASDTTVDDVVDAVVEMFDSEELAAILNNVIADVTDFGALKSAIESGDPVLSYTMTIGAWDVEVEHAEGDYLTANVVTTDRGDRTFNVVITGDDEYKDIIENVLGVLDETTTITDKDGGQNWFVMSDGFSATDDKNFVLDWSASADVKVDLSKKPEYVVMLCTVIAEGLGNGAAKEALLAGVDTYNTLGSVKGMEEAFNALTTADIVTAVKNLNEAGEIDDIVEELGLTPEVGNAVAKLVAAVLSRVEINGGSRTMESFLRSGWYTADKSNLDKSFTRELFRGYSLTLDAEISSVSVAVKLFDAVEANAPEFVDETGTPEVEVSGKIAGAAVDTEGGYIFIDAHYDGITAGELKSAITLYAINADAIDVTIGEDGDDAIVCNGTELVAVASGNSTEATDTVEYIIIIMGDVNNNGRNESGDASLIIQNVVGLIDFSVTEELAADITWNTRVESGDAYWVASKWVTDWDKYESELN